jgi:hypothetical protein
MSIIIAAVSGNELATVYLTANHAQNDDIGQTRPSHNAAPLRPNQVSFLIFYNFKLILGCIVQWAANSWRRRRRSVILE